MPVAASVVVNPSGPVSLTVAVGISWSPQDTWMCSMVKLGFSLMILPLVGHEGFQVQIRYLPLLVGKKLESLESLGQLVGGQVISKFVEPGAETGAAAEFAKHQGTAGPSNGRGVHHFVGGTVPSGCRPGGCRRRGGRR